MKIGKANPMIVRTNPVVAIANPRRRLLMDGLMKYAIMPMTSVIRPVHLSALPTQPGSVTAAFRSEISVLRSGPLWSGITDACCVWVSVCRSALAAVSTTGYRRGPWLYPTSSASIRVNVEMARYHPSGTSGPVIPRMYDPVRWATSVLADSTPPTGMSQ